MLAQSQKSGHNKIIAYACRLLNDAEKRYSQIERECLAVHLGCVIFQMYLLARVLQCAATINREFLC